VRFLAGRRLDQDVVEPPEAAVVREALLRSPCFGDDRKRLFEARIGLLERDRETPELVVAITLADAEIEPASDRRSKVAACSAKITGLCHGSTITAVPSRRVVVRAASHVSSVSVAETWFQPVK
jgi:hypothetical protein